MKDITEALKGKIINLLNNENQNEGTVEYSTSIKQLIDIYYNCSKLLEVDRPVKDIVEPETSEEKKPIGRPKGTGGKYNKKEVEPEITYKKMSKTKSKHTHHKSPVYSGYSLWSDYEVQLLQEAIEQYPPKTTTQELFKIFDTRTPQSILSKIYKLGGYVKNNLVIKDRGVDV